MTAGIQHTVFPNKCTAKPKVHFSVHFSLLSWPRKGEMHFSRGAHGVPHSSVLQVLLHLPQSRAGQRLIHPPLLMGIALINPRNSHFQVSHGDHRAENPWMQQWQTESLRWERAPRSQNPTFETQDYLPAQDQFNFTVHFKELWFLPP